ncbi:hypothetical protein [Streptomyces xiamenensis]|uniref:hypothetical protein n=1 Tax=Streptomyces xiamenensis TaxID=408015 RepID=UPI0037D96F09
MTLDGYASLVVERGEMIAAPPGPRRRTAAQGKFESSYGYIRDGIAWLSQRLRVGGLDDPVFYAHELSLEITSYLYAAGAEVDIWREWSLLSSWGSEVRGDSTEMVAYAVLGGRWDHLRGQSIDVDGQSLPGAVVWSMVVGADSPVLPECVDEVDEAWVRLAVGARCGDHGQTEASLRKLCEFWMMEDEEWDLFEPRSYPCFDPYLCAAVLLARHGGYQPKHLSAEIRCFLGPGLSSRC